MMNFKCQVDWLQGSVCKWPVSPPTQPLSAIWPPHWGVLRPLLTNPHNIIVIIIIIIIIVIIIIIIPINPPLVYPLGHHHHVGEKTQARVLVYLKMAKNRHRDEAHSLSFFRKPCSFSLNLKESVPRGQQWYKDQVFSFPSAFSNGSKFENALWRKV